MPSLRRSLVATLFVFVPVVVGVAWPLWWAEQDASSAPATVDTDRVERGRYLIATSACTDCHTPHVNGRPVEGAHLAGHPETLRIDVAPEAGAAPWIVRAAGTLTAWAGPWGVSYTRNLTPDVETGIGAWTEENFVATLREMRHMGLGRPLLPPMPDIYGKNMTDDDLKAIYAYLRTIPAVRNRVPDPLPPAVAQVE